MRLISNEYRTNIVEFFLNDVAVNEYYIFASTIDSKIVLRNTVADKKEFLNKTIFGKKVDPSEAFPVIKNYPWRPGEVFEQYDDIADLDGKKFYAIVYPENSNTGSYLIFKCLFNNYGQTSEVAPFYDPEVEDQIYNTADGYVWKFMYSLSLQDFDKYNAFGYVPIIEEANTAFVDSKSISHIEVENPDLNFGYGTFTGTIREVNVEELILVAGNGTTLNAFTNFYRGQTLYVTDINNVSRLYEILTYSYSAATGTGRMTVKDLDDFIQPGSSYSILPKIEILGDGYEASAIPIIAAGQIKRVIMLNKGYGYNSATASIIDPEFDFNPDNLNTSDERAIVRPILAPGVGHGMNIARELYCNSALLYAGITEADNIEGIIPTVNTYARVGVVKNPEFNTYPSPVTFDNRIYAEFETQSFFQENDRAIQTDELTSNITFEGIVHEAANNAVYLAEYVGAYQNRENTSVSFDPNLPLRNELNQTYVINNSVISDYVQRTGEVIYIASFTTPVFRGDESKEQYKVILQF
jgi:hypothetical protein